MNRSVYFDFAATTPVDPRVVDAMLPYFNQDFGNSSSIHRWGQRAEGALEHSREILAQNLNCLPTEIIFTGCGSESDNLALRGVALAAQRSRGANHILISPVEHHAISKTALQLAELFGFIVEYVPVDSRGRVDPEDVSKRIRPTTAIVSIIFANNEIGTINPIDEIGQICKSHNVPFHTDAVQAAAYLPIDVNALNVDLLSLGAHKFYGPKGVGALFFKKGTSILPVLTGGGQENGLRAGTHNIAYIVGMAEAYRLTNLEKTQRILHVKPMQEKLLDQVIQEIPESRITGHPTTRLPNHASFVFRSVNGNKLLMILDLEGFACSSGSACKTGSPEPSDVILALGYSREWAFGSLRLSLGTLNIHQDIEAFLNKLPDAISRSRNE